MSLAEPEWRVKTRPCIFYQQGRCLFGDSCNFVHAEGNWSPHEPTLIDSPHRSPTSPSRSPRIANLLAALKDVIGEDADEENMTQVLDSMLNAKKTVVQSPDSIYAPLQDDTVRTVRFAAEPVVLPSLDSSFDSSAEDELPGKSVLETDDDDHPGPSMPTKGENIASGFDHSNEDEGNLSTYNISQDPFRGPVEDLDTSFFTSYESPERTAPAEDPVQTQARQGTPDLLSPIDIPGLHLVSLSALASEDHLVSGLNPAEDDWIGPMPLVRSPPRSPTVPSPFAFLASPFGSPSRIASPRLGAFPGRAPPSPLSPHYPIPTAETEVQELDLTLDSPTAYHQEQESKSQDTHGQEADFCGAEDGPEGSTARWDVAGNDTSVFIGQTKERLADDILNETVADVEDAIRRVQESPAHHLFESGALSFEEAEMVASSSFQEDSPAEVDESDVFSPQHSIAEDDTAHLAYLSVTPGPPQPPSCDNDDTLYSLYGVYSDLEVQERDFERRQSAAILEALSRPKSLEASKERVFTPPPSSTPVSRARSETIRAPLPSPPPSTTREKPRSWEEQVGMSVRPAMEPEHGSTRVPFGFRPTTIKNARNSIPPSDSNARHPYRSTSGGSRPTTPGSTFSPIHEEPPNTARNQARGLKPLRLSTLFNYPPSDIAFFRTPTSPYFEHPRNSSRSRSSVSSNASLFSDFSLSDNPLLSSTSNSLIPEHLVTSAPHPNRLSISSLSISEPDFDQENDCHDFTKAPLSAPPIQHSYARPSFEDPTSSTHGAGYARPNSRLSYHGHPSSPTSHRSTMQRPSRPPSTQIDRRASTSSPSRFQPRSPGFTETDTRNSRLSIQTDRLSTLSFSSQPKSPAIRHPDFERVRNSHVVRSSSQLSEPGFGFDPLVEDDGEDTEHFRSASAMDHEPAADDTIRRSMMVYPTPHMAPASQTHSPLVSTSALAAERPHAIATPSPSLMFAIAGDDPKEVQRVLQSGEAGPNDSVGPQSALEFALTNDQLENKLEIVKTLLSYGANPVKTVKNTEDEVGPDRAELDAATKYYVEKADSALTRRASALMHRSKFRPLAKLRYGIIGQDRALEQLFRVLSIQQISPNPIVIMFCGPSGLGKSFLAQKFGPALDVPTHTVNMTTLRTAHDLWQSYSMNPPEDGPRCTLSEFLINNEGRRCVVVLDELEKTEDPRALWSLLVPWELGRCSFEANSLNVDVRNVIWIGTSNIGQELILDHHASRKDPDDIMLRTDYVELMGQLRPKVSERLGASMLSRVTTLLPFVPFTSEERRAIASEALHSLSSDFLKGLPPQASASIVEKALGDFVPGEGARSLYRAVSDYSIDTMDHAG